MKKDFPPESTACFTGHRNLSAAVCDELRSAIASALSQSYEKGYRVFLCGGARGFDTLAALEVLSFRHTHPDIRLVMVIPCASQADRWSAEEKELWKYVCNHADEVRILSKSYYNGCMQTRNRYMVDASSLCLCYLVHFQGGTWSTVRYAMHSGILLKNLAMPSVPAMSMRESQWNYISIFHSVSENVHIVRLSLSPLQKKKKMCMSRFSCVKRS